MLDGCSLGSALAFFVCRVGCKGDEDEKAAQPAPQRDVSVRKHAPPERQLLGHLTYLRARAPLCDPTMMRRLRVEATNSRKRSADVDRQRHARTHARTYQRR